MPTITSMGTGSGLDIAGIITQLMTAERMPEKQIIKKQADFTAKLTAIGTVKGAISSFQTSVQALSSSYQFRQMTATLGDSSIASATATSIAAIGSHTLNVTQLAQNQSVKTATFSGIDSTIGTGHLSIQFGQISGQLKNDGTYYNSNAETGTPPVDNSVGAPPIPATFTVNSGQASLDLDITGSNNTLAGVRDAINAKNAGVTASIVNDGSGFRLVLASTATGAKSSMRVTVTGDADADNNNAAGLSQLAYDPTKAVGSGQNLSQSQQARDAIFSLDGIAITRSSNVVNDALSGVSLTLQKVSTGNTSLTIGRDTSGVQANVQAFVKGYNDLQQQLRSLTAYDQKSNKAAVLQGDSALRSLQYQMRQLMNGTLAGSGNYRTLSSVGISFDKTGVMTFDSSKLSGALSTSPDSVAALFGVFATSSDSQISYVNSTGNTKAGNYGVSITQLATQGVVRGSAASSKDLSAVATPTLAVQIDGFQSATISLSQKNYASFDDIAADLQSKINGDSTLKAAGITASVSFDSSANRFVIASARYGTSSKAQVSSIDPTLASQLGLSVGTQATLAAGTLLSSTVDATNDTFSISVDGAASTAITLTQGSYTGASLASEIQSKLTGAGLNAIAVYNATANRIELASGTTGTSSAIELTAVGSNSGATLGLATGKGSVTGLDVAGRIGNNAATGSGQYLTGLGDAAGLNILVAGGSASPGGAARGSIAFNKGFAYQLDQLFGAALSDKGVLNADAQGFQSQIDRLEAQDVRFNQRLSRVQALYVQQFTTLDTTIARLRQTSASLSQSLASLPKAS